MISLYYNEMIKIVKKKSFLIFMLILLGFIILTNFIYLKVDSLLDSTYENYDSMMYESLKESYDRGERDSIFLEEYAQAKTQYDVRKIKDKYKKDSWQYNYLESDETLYDYLSNINSYELGTNKNKELYEETQKQYEEYLKKLDSNSWEDIVQERKTNIEKEIKDTNNEIKDIKTNDGMSKYEADRTIKALNIQLSMLNLELEECNYRLDNSLGFDHKLNRTFTFYYDNKKSLLEYENLDVKNLSANELNEYGSIVSNVELYKYRLDNKIETTSIPQASDLISTFFQEYSFFILIFILMVSGAIVSQEFSKGTIKLLLIKPYSRFKILLSKYFAVLTSIVVVSCIGLILQLIVGSLFFGTSSLSEPMFFYSSVNDKVISMNVFLYWFKTFLAILPQYVMIGTLSFAASTLFSNTALAVITGFAGNMGSSIITSLLEGSLAKYWWAKYFIGFHMDFSNYVFGIKPLFKDFTLGFSLAVWSVYLLILLVASFVYFIKRDIKNV